MEKGIHYIENVFEYNDLLGVETLHPLVSVIDLSKAHPMKHVRHIFGFYAIFLKEVKCGDLLYGRQRYDYQEGTLVAWRGAGYRHRKTTAKSISRKDGR